ncbi:NAD-dependent epimerase/dehydratase family protein [soil metagenome]
MVFDPTAPIFVTGGSGLIGSFLISHLLREGHRVRAVYRGQEPSVPFPERVEWVKGDLLDVPFLRKALQGVQYVFHCAGLVSYAPQDEDLLMQVNVEGTANIVNSCLEAGAVKLCHVSSVAAVGRPKGIAVLNEETKWDQTGNHPAYARSKYFGELEVWRGVAEGLQAVIVNPSVVLGPADWNRSSTQLFKYVAGEKIFYPKGSANFVDVRDVVEAMVKLTFSDIAGERFILNQGSCSYKAFFDQVAHCLQKKAPYVQAPPALTEIIWRVEHVRSWVTGKRPLITKETARLAGPGHTFRNEKLKDVIGFTFRPLEETIRWTCEKLQERQMKVEPVHQ